MTEASPGKKKHKHPLKKTKTEPYCSKVSGLEWHLLRKRRGRWEGETVPRRSVLEAHFPAPSTLPSSFFKARVLTSLDYQESVIVLSFSINARLVA